MTGGAVWVGYASSTDSSSRGYLDLASGSGGLLIAASPALNALTQGTLALWLSAPRGSPAAVLACRLDAAGGAVLTLNAAGRVLFTAFAGSDVASTAASPTAVTDGLWHLLSVSFGQAEGQGASVYVDGVGAPPPPAPAPGARALRASAAWQWPPTAPLTVGFSSPSSSLPLANFSGVLGAISLYDYSLAPTQLSSVQEVVAPFVAPSPTPAAAPPAFDASDVGPLKELKSLAYCPVSSSAGAASAKAAFPACVAQPTASPQPLLFALDDDGYAAGGGAAATAAPACSGCPPGAYIDFISGVCGYCPAAPTTADAVVPWLLLGAYFAAVAACVAAAAAAVSWWVGRPIYDGVQASLMVGVATVPILQLLAQTGAGAGPFLSPPMREFFALIAPLIASRVGLPPPCQSPEAAFAAQITVFSSVGAIAALLVAEEALHCTWPPRGGCALRAWRKPWVWAAAPGERLS